MMPTIYVDNRVGADEDLANWIHGDVVIQKLDFADISWEGNGPDGLPVQIGVERKRLLDLINSIQSGRLSGHQLHGLMAYFDHVYLLIEGLWKADDNGLLCRFVRGRWTPVQLGQRRFMAREVEMYLNTLQVMCGVKVWRTENVMQSGRWLRDLAAWWGKPWEKHKAHQQFVVAGGKAGLLHKPNLVHRIAKEFDGVGWDKGKEIGKVFGSAVELAMAEESDLLAVPGIGKKLAKSIVGELHKTGRG